MGDQQRFLRSENTVQMKQAQSKKTQEQMHGGRRSRSRSPPPREDRRRGDSRARQRPRPRSYSRSDRGGGGRRSEVGEFCAWLGGLPRGVEEDEIVKFLKGFGRIESVRIR